MCITSTSDLCDRVVLVVCDSFQKVACRGFVRVEPQINVRVWCGYDRRQVNLRDAKSVGHDDDTKIASKRSSPEGSRVEKRRAQSRGVFERSHVIHAHVNIGQHRDIHRGQGDFDTHYKSHNLLTSLQLEPRTQLWALQLPLQRTVFSLSWPALGPLHHRNMPSPDFRPKIHIATFIWTLRRGFQQDCQTSE